MSTYTTPTLARARAKITLRPSSARGHADHGWLKTYHTFSFASYQDPSHTSFGPLRVLNEDRVAPHQGFPTHPHRDAEIFSYVLSGELTHRDSMVKSTQESAGGNDFYRMKRGDVQFTTGGTGIAHSERNESGAWVHFLQIWALPWKKALRPRYHTRSFGEEGKREAFVPILSPLAAGVEATGVQEEEARPRIEGTIPIHADLVMGAGLLAPGGTFLWSVGGKVFGNGVVASKKRRVYLHLAMTQGGKAKVRVGETELSEGDGCYVENVSEGDSLPVESVGEAEAEVVVLDGN
ncbi:MAG: hypothetical protein MMC23_005116 [Stictis urceolatum]|nr:hypothetical protein [Stictis urceolata]